MPRIRAIKPDAFKSDTLARTSYFARWLFAGLWTYCDDSGRGRGDTRLIAAELFALDDMVTPSTVESALDELGDAVCRYEVDGRRYVHLPKWHEHQRVSHPAESKLPECPVHSGNPPESLRKSSEKLRLEGEGEQGTGKGSVRATAPNTRPPRTCPKHPTGTDTPCRPCGAARVAHDTWQKPTLSAKTTMCGEHPTHPAAKCPDCAAAVKADPDAIAKIRQLAKKKTA